MLTSGTPLLIEGLNACPELNGKTVHVIKDTSVTSLEDRVEVRAPGETHGFKPKRANLRHVNQDNCFSEMSHYEGNPGSLTIGGAMIKASICTPDELSRFFYLLPRGSMWAAFLERGGRRYSDPNKCAIFDNADDVLKDNPPPYEQQVALRALGDHLRLLLSER